MLCGLVCVLLHGISVSPRVIALCDNRVCTSLAMMGGVIPSFLRTADALKNIPRFTTTVRTAALLCCCAAVLLCSSIRHA